MNNCMIPKSQYKDYNEFLAKHSAKNSENSGTITHTRIPSKELNIYGGSYIIPKDELPIFHALYYNHVFEKKNKEYLTEKQLQEGGPIAVDFDFRYSHNITERQHNVNHISDILIAYSDQLKEYFKFEPDKPFPAYIFEKPNVNRLEDGSKTKDGIHMILGLQADRTIQTMLREKMITTLEERIDLPLTNDWGSVLDEGISKGQTGWQLYGSRKPSNEMYELTYYFTIGYDPSDGECTINQVDLSEFNLKRDFSKLSVQYESNVRYEMNPKIMAEYNKRSENKNIKIKKPLSKTKVNLIVEDNGDEDEETIGINDINDEGTLMKAVSIMLKNFKDDYELKEIHEFTQALPEKYYEPGSHSLNRQVAFALKNTSDKLFLSWIQLRSKASDFDYNTIPSLYNTWKSFHKTNADGNVVTKRSIRYWVKNDNPEEYERIRMNTIDYYIDQAMNSTAEYDFALILKEMFKDMYICVSYEKRGIWYRFKNHRWFQDKGLSLRAKISKDMHSLFEKKYQRLEKESFEYPEGDERKKAIMTKMTDIVKAKSALKRTTSKDHILREAAEIFYDENFVKCVDTNRYLLCFENGVIDFKNKCFRDGLPEDYITKTTGINYMPYNETNKNDENWKKTEAEIHDFMAKLFPKPDLRRYMWDHLASCLIGTNKNQTFHVYYGNGSNGKSLLVDLMSHVLGEYKGTVPITLVTDARGKIGGTSSEVIQLKGTRMAVMQEPSKGVKLNEGVMKELTGGDPIQARGLWSESEIFIPQFKLIVGTNNLFDIESNDDGTWRRIRKCVFQSKFVDDVNDSTYSQEQYKDTCIYQKDKSLEEKLVGFAPIFASILVSRAFETDGIVEECETVMRESNKYRKDQDHISAYISENVIRTDDPKIVMKKSVLLSSFGEWFKKEQPGKKVPKGDELYEYMSNKFGAPGKKGWVGLNFVVDETEDDVIDDI